MMTTEPNTMSTHDTEPTASGSSTTYRAAKAPGNVSLIKSIYRNVAVYSVGAPRPTINGFCGAMAGVASGIVTCPLDVIKTKLQAQGSFRRGVATTPRQAVYHGLAGTARTIWKEDGFRGMYRGLSPMILGYLPTWAVYMSVYDASRQFYYTNFGKTCPVWKTMLRRDLRLTWNRQQSDGSSLRIVDGRCMLYARH
jgi:solute carrier family 25 (mitochondrial folate transporter), member 32